MTALTQSDIDALKKAIALGQRRVRYAGSGGSSYEAEYQSVADMLKALAYAENELASESAKRPASTFAVFDRGDADDRS